MTHIFVVHTVLPNGNFTKYFSTKMDAAQSVVDLLTMIKLGPASIMTIRQEQLEESFAFIVTIESSVDIETPRSCSEWWNTSNKIPDSSFR